MTSKTGKVGFVGGMNFPLIHKFEAGFRAGVKHVCPKCTIISQYAGVTPEAFRNPGRGKELALSQYQQGVNVIFHASGSTGLGVFEAARQLKIRNVVWASSETVLGLPFDTPPPYVPVDEEYPARPETSYSLGKHLDEQMAAQFCRWNPQLKMIGLRFSNVMEPADYEAFPSFDADPSLRKWNLWGYIDARDGAQAVRRALELKTTGMDVFIIAAADTVMSRPNDELIAGTFPGVPLKRQVGSHETLVSIEKARRVLGYEPRHSWRD